MPTSPTPADRPADQLRAAIAETLRRAACTGGCDSTETECAASRVQPVVYTHGVLTEVWGTPEVIADAVLSVLPAPADRAAVLRWVAATLDGRAAVLKDLSSSDYGEESFAARELTEQADRLRALAADAAAGVQPPTTTEAHRPCVEYIAEVLENDGVWMYLGADPDPAVATRRRASVTRRHPDAETRTVRKTTTYTVEPEPAAPAAPEEPQ